MNFEPITEKKVIDLIAYALQIPTQQIFPYSDFKDDFDLDDMDRMLLIAKLEKRFNSYLTKEEVAAIRTVKDASFFLQKHAA